MGVKFFGQFLIEQGVISRDQLLLATQLQDSRNRTLGAIAVSKGYLTTAQAAEINRQQKSTDRRFGELALDMGVMQPAQVEDVLATQAATRIRIGEALAELGFVREAVLQKELKAFADDQALYQTGTIELPEGTPHPEFVRIAIDLTDKLLLRVGSVVGKRGVIVGAGHEPPPSALLTIRIPFSGQLNADYTASASRDVAFTITRRMLGSAVTLSDELAVDALKEFCNIVCGNVCAKLSDADSPLEIGPPEEGVDFSDGNAHGVLVPIHVPDGRFELRLHFR